MRGVAYFTRICGAQGSYHVRAAALRRLSKSEQEREWSADCGSLLQIGELEWTCSLLLRLRQYGRLE
jgi:hypothetical protein